MTTPEILITQIVISLVVVALYHLWSSGQKKTSAPPIQVPDPDPNPNLNPSPIPTPSPVPAPAPALPVLAATAPKPSPAPEQPSPEILAVIAAAITVAFGRPHRVLSVQPSGHAPELNLWAVEGRLKQFMSHKVR